MKTILDVTAIKDHPDIKSVYTFLEGHGFATPYCDEIRKFLPDKRVQRYLTSWHTCKASTWRTTSTTWA